MPKGKKKGKDLRRERDQSSEDESLNDNLSETSAHSDLRSTHEDGGEVEDGDSASSRLEEKVCECIELLDAKAAATRAGAFESLRSGLSRRYLAHVLAAHRATLADHVCKALRKGKTQERRAAAVITPLLAIQVGEEGGEEFASEVRPALVAVVTDGGADPELRAECCSALSALCMLLEEDVSAVLELLAAFETIFSGSYLKGDGSVKVSGAAVAAGSLHAAALDAWTLLLPLVPREHARAMLLGARMPHLRHLVQLLEAYSLEVRMAAGGALAMVHEHISDEDDTEVEDGISAALPLLADLARDSNKFRAKRDRKLQRATFRDILKYLEQDDEFVCESVRVGTEAVTLDTWAERAAYSALAGALGAALQACVPCSSALRAALNMSAAPPQALTPKDVRLNKLQRHLQNAAAFKARSISRGKNRDKRSALLTP